MHDHSDISRRKREHLAPFRGDGNPSGGSGTWLECVHLVHQALPGLHASEIDLSVSFLGKALRAPLFLTGTTGGTPVARSINRDLAQVAEELGIAFGLGSQRAMLEHPDLEETYRVRDVAPTVFLAGNLGGVQLAAIPTETVRTLLDRVGADALCIHLNPAQEMVQPGGDRDFRGVQEAIERTARNLAVPCIVKEVGCGLSREAALSLAASGIAALDAAGAGGTSWVAVELGRRGDGPDPDREAFRDWGIPTAAAIGEALEAGLPVIGSGGVRTGLDIARALALGATLAGIAAPAIQAWVRGGREAVRKRLERMLEGLRIAMTLVGARDLPALRSAPRVILPPLRTWLEDRGGPRT